MLAMLATVPLLVRTSTFSAIAIAIAVDVAVDFVLFCFVFSLFVVKMKSSRTLKKCNRIGPVRVTRLARGPSWSGMEWSGDYTT